MSVIRVNSIVGADGVGSVDLPKGTSGIGTDIKFAPLIIDYSPEGGSSGVANTQDVVFTFDQPIQFSDTAQSQNSYDYTWMTQDLDGAANEFFCKSESSRGIKKS